MQPNLGKRNDTRERQSMICRLINGLDIFTGMILHGCYKARAQNHSCNLQFTSYTLLYILLEVAHGTITSTGHLFR